MEGTIIVTKQSAYMLPLLSLNSRRSFFKKSFSLGRRGDKLCWANLWGEEIILHWEINDQIMMPSEEGSFINDKCMIQLVYLNWIFTYTYFSLFFIYS